MKTSLNKIMRSAQEKGMVIPAFNIAHLPMVEPIARTLKNTKTFCLIEVARPDIEKFGAKSFAAVAREYRKWTDPNFMRLHLDHVPVIDEDGKEVEWKKIIEEALALGYDSVMIDGSRLPLKENIAATREVVQIAHKKNVPVEAELGAVLGHEKGPLPPYEELFKTGKGFTRVDEAKKFVEETGVDWLSVAIGSIHGAISGAAKDKAKVEAKLNIDHLKKLKEITGVPLVLHGGSGINRLSVLEGIKNGITKINVGTEIRQAYEKGLDLGLKIEKIIRDYYGIEGSANTLCLLDG
ncbi:MAG: class II fructose-bisphosphate aldolase [Candidatus Omnitrophica bacterium]|nr:class II fructose-bisphosphate aldolase [Candidatus Omnitrophota bacterium]